MSTIHFYDKLIQEIDHNILSLPEPAHQTLRNYYRSMTKNPSQREFYRYNWTRRTSPMTKLITSWPKSKDKLRILDAGCGVGTESIYWSMLRNDVEVIGVDVSSDRLETAILRKQAYERHLNKALQLSFIEEDVFDVLDSKKIALVWTMEAISHIDPAEQFISKVRQSLVPKGYLIISDSHLSNPIMAWKIFKMRRKGTPLRSNVTISTGKTISYTHERLFTIRNLRNILKQKGFNVADVQFSIFFPPILARFPKLFAMARLSESILCRLPLIRNFGGIYTLTATI